MRPLGNTGEMVSMLGLGGYHIGESRLSDREAIDIIRAAINQGITFLDNSWDYHRGRSETLVGKALHGTPRESAFVMTKIDGRTAREATHQLDESLRRLRVDYIDLLQHHEIIRFDDADRVFAEGGAHEALLKASDRGKIRFIGFTGHKDPRIHLYMLEKSVQHRFHFDAVQMPLNVMDWHFRSFEKLVLPELVKRGIAVLGMKSLGHGVILASGAVTAEECLRYSLSLPTSVVIVGIDSMPVLRQAIRVGSTFTPMTEKECNDIRIRTARVARFGEYELFKTSSHFDATAEHPDWLGDEAERVKELTL